jgi:HSP20 family protein
LTTERWDPFREIENTWARMGNLLSDVAGGSVSPVARSPLAALAAFTVPVDVEETDDEFVIELELPGVSKDDLSIDLRGDELVITGEIKEREKKGIVRRQTRRVGQFEHRITLPGDVDPDSVTARLDNGVLTIRLAKAQRSEPRHIEISS